jgi:minor histocompatibility antigen H13
MASTPGPVMELLGRVAFEATKMRPLLPTYLHLLLSAIFPIYTAAHASLARPKSAAKPEKKNKDATGGDALDDDDDDLQVVQKIESLTAWDALTFPLLAGTTLTSLYFLIKWLEDPAILNKILAVYFSQMGLFFGAKFLKDVFSTIRSFLLPMQYSIGGFKWHADAANSCFTAKGPVEAKSHSSPLPGRLRNIPLPARLSSAIWTLRAAAYKEARLQLEIHKLVKGHTSIDLLDVLSVVVVVLIVAWQTFVSTPWYLTNFMGFAFCYGSLQMVSPTTGWIGSLVLSALFVYDIYFVFFTPMMVTVATKLEVPIKLLFPRPDGCVLPLGVPQGSQTEIMQEYLDCLAKKRTMAMLGLGDIVIPGMMLAFALRFDLYRFYLGEQTSTKGDSGAGDLTKKERKYTRATGGWGERFWTNSKLRGEDLQAKTFPKSYFHAGVFGYVVGMIVTMIVMQVAQHAQPALLYLVPGVLISLWGTALFKGDLKLFWAYTEEEEEEKSEKTAKTGKKDEKEKDGKDSGISTTQEDAASDSEATNLKQPSDSEAPSKSNPLPAQSASPISLISFSITLPAPKVVSPAAAPTLPLPVKAKDASSSSSDSSYDVLPDIKADHEVMDMLSREISRSKEMAAEEATVTTTSRDGEPAGKRRRKA